MNKVAAQQFAHHLQRLGHVDQLEQAAKELVNEVDALRKSWLVTVDHPRLRLTTIWRERTRLAELAAAAAREVLNSLEEDE